WWPKWTPASSNCFMVTTATGANSLFLGFVFVRPLRCASRTHTVGVQACGFPTRGSRVAAQCSRTGAALPEAVRPPLRILPQLVPAFIRRHIRADERRLRPGGRGLHSGVHPPPYPGRCTPVGDGRGQAGRSRGAREIRGGGAWNRAAGSASRPLTR